MCFAHTKCIKQWLVHSFIYVVRFCNAGVNYTRCLNRHLFFIKVNAVSCNLPIIGRVWGVQNKSCEHTLTCPYTLEKCGPNPPILAGTANHLICMGVSWLFPKSRGWGKEGSSMSLCSHTLHIECTLFSFIQERKMWECSVMNLSRLLYFLWHLAQ